MTEVTWSENEMSNFDHTIDPGMADDLRAGMRSHHNAWDFNGEVRWDPERGLFVETVRCYRAVVGEVSAPTLEELMTKVNDEYGWA